MRNGGKTLYGAAYDRVRLEQPIKLTDADTIAHALAAISNCEIKSTNRNDVGDEFEGYFFNTTAGELLTAQSAGVNYRFVFVDTLTGAYKELGLNEVFGRAPGMYPAWHIRF